MIVGNGDIASVLKEVDRNDTIFFASGVSNSLEERDTEFRREVDLLLKSQDDFKRFVYFSSLSIFYKDSPYTRHKLNMERTVKNFPKYTIIRLGNITWGDNPHTIINYFRNAIKNKQELELRNEYRYIVEKNEFLHWIEMIPDWNCEMNITGKMMTTLEIYEQYGNTE